MQDQPSAPQPEHQHQHSMGAAAMPPAHHMPMHEAAAPVHGDYPSNPLLTAKNAVTTLWRNGGSVFGGIVAVEVLVAVVAGVAFVIALVAALIAILGNYLVNSGALEQFLIGFSGQASPDNLQSLESILRAGGAATVVAIISGAIAAFAIAYMQAIYLSYASFAVVQRQTAHFGQVMSLAFKRTGPLMVQVLIILAALVLVGALPFFFLPSDPTLTNIAITIGIVLYLLVAVVVAFGVGLRLSFAALAVVAEKMNPIKAFGYSWQLTKKRTWEILGAASVIGTVGTIVNLLFLFLSNATQSASGISLVIGILELIWGIALGVGGVAVVAERFNQARSVGQSHHKVNYTLNVGMFVLALIVSLIVSDITKAISPAAPAFNLPSSSQDTNSNVPSDQQLQQELQKYYQDSLQNQTPSTQPSTDNSGGYQLN